MTDVAIVAGGAAEITIPIAERFAANGLDIGLLAASESAMKETAHSIEAMGRSCILIETDLSDGESVAKAMADVSAALGEPTVLVNAISTGAGADSDRFGAAVAGLRSAFVVGRASLDVLTVDGGGRLIHVVDGGEGHDLTLGDGLEGFTRTVAFEVKALRVTVNLVAPVSRSLTGYPDRAADAVCLLAGRGADSLTGQTLRV